MAVSVGLCATAVNAAPDEIVVFTDEFEKKGGVGYELHLNYASRARKTPDFPGEQAPHHVFRFMPEIVWGLSDKWNLGLHFPLSYDRSTNSTTLDGAKLRVHYLNVNEQRPDSTTFYGVNYEISAYHKRISESRYNAEIRGILGTRRGDWRFSVNPILTRALSDNPDGKHIEFEVFGQVLRSFGEDFAIGVEHYSSLGKLSSPTFGSQSGQTTYLVMDFKTKYHFDIHIGVGHGWTDPVDKRVFKALIGLPF
ncbi:MAG: hypothetical protein ABL891_18185 [Burkholderiales bacterium]